MTHKEDLNFLLRQLGEEKDLILRTEKWLTQEKISISADIDEKVRELEKILVAIKVKNMLQDKNMVALKQVLRNDNGSIKDIIIKIMSLPDAIDMCEKSENHLDKINYLKHMTEWDKEGYDIKLSADLRINPSLE